MIKTRIFNLAKSLVNLIKRLIKPDSQSLPDNQIMILRPNSQFNNETTTLKMNVYPDRPMIPSWPIVSGTPEFIPARHPHASPAAQQRAAKKRRMARARSRK